MTDYPMLHTDGVWGGVDLGTRTRPQPKDTR